MNFVRVLIVMVVVLACLALGFIIGKDAFSPAATPTADAAATFQARVAATATALSLTAQPGPGQTRPSIAITLYPAQVLDPTRMVVSGEVTVTGPAPDAVRMEFYLQPDEAGALPGLMYADVDGSDGWSWAWPTPECCWRGRVWAVAYYADGSRAYSNSIQVFTPDLLVTPAP
jgi:hypothetical protein